MLKISAHEVTLQCIVYTHSFEMLTICILILHLLNENAYTKSACVVPNGISIFVHLDMYTHCCDWYKLPI